MDECKIRQVTRVVELCAWRVLDAIELVDGPVMEYPMFLYRGVGEVNLRVVMVGWWGNCSFWKLGPINSWFKVAS